VSKQQLIDFDNGKITQLSCTVYNHLDGMRESECNGRRQPSAWKSRDGKLWFTSIAGVVCVDPNNLCRNKVKPPVYIEHIMTRDSTTHRWQSQPIHLQAKDRDLEVKYTALSYAIPERVKFKYRLLGYEKAWEDAGNRRTAFYTNLTKGDYEFQVIACNNDGIWNEQGASVQLIIPPFWWETWWAYIFYITSGITMLVWFIRRRYKRKFVETQLQLEREHANRLEELDKVKSRFFAGVSHEFRTPLTLIKGPLQDLLTITKNIENRSLMQMMLRNTHRLERLVNQLLDLAQLQSGKLILQARPVRVSQFLKGIVASFESYARRKEIDLVFKPPLQLTSLIVYIDPDKMEKAMINLLSNALKYTPEGGTVKITISLEKIDSKEGVAIRVKDSGIGISQDALPHIFDYFYRYRNENNFGEEGAGIGLALTKELISLHHGDITVTSGEDVGSEFTIRLLLGKDFLKPEEIISEHVEDWELSETTMPPQPSIKQVETGTFQMEQERILKPHSNTATILLVEDNPDMRAYLRRHLQLNYRLIEATNGKDGLQKAASDIPDLIISDVMMPYMDGYELCKNLKTNELTSHIPVILLTAKGSPESKIEGLEMGAVDYLTKPVDIEELNLRLKNLIEFQTKFQERLRKQITTLDVTIAGMPVTSADERFLKKAMEIVEKEITKSNFNATKFANEMAMSRAHLNRKLCGLLGQKTNEFIRTIRLKRAAELLRKGSGSVSEIAYQVGFNHLSYFARCFKVQYSVMPSEYHL